METFAGDKDYEVGNAHFNLELWGLHPAIRLKRTCNENKDNNKQVWLELVKISQYKDGLKERYKIERKFGEAKQAHGFGCCRYIRTARFAIQSYLMAFSCALSGWLNSWPGLISSIGFTRLNNLERIGGSSQNIGTFGFYSGLWDVEYAICHDIASILSLLVSDEVKFVCLFILSNDICLR